VSQPTAIWVRTTLTGMIRLLAQQKSHEFRVSSPTFVLQTPQTWFTCLPGGFGYVTKIILYVKTHNVQWRNYSNYRSCSGYAY